MWRHIAKPLLLIGLGMIPYTAQAEPGVFDDRIVFGQSAAFGGPAAALGLGMREGIQAAFNEVNRAGGVHGRKLTLISYDDGYEPDRASANTNRLINDDKVFALIGEVGTPTSQAAQPIATEAHVPFIGPFTGAGFLRNPSLSRCAGNGCIPILIALDANPQKMLAVRGT